MEAVTINLWGGLLWCWYCILTYWFCGWQLQHVWHFHPILRWAIAHFWQAVMVAAFLDVCFSPGPVVVTGYFMGTLIGLEVARHFNPISRDSILAPRPSHALSIQDRETWILAVWHLFGLSLVL
jgi:hypothetical protein